MTDLKDPYLTKYNRNLMSIEVDQIGVGSVEMWNRLASLATGEYLMMVNDDNIMNTYGWDEVFMAQKPNDDIFVAWPNGQGAQCVNPIISRRLFKALDYFIPRGFNWWYADTALHSLGAYMGRLVYMPNVTVLSTEHKEQVKGDIRVNQDISRFHEWKKIERKRDAERVWALMS